MVRIKGRYQLLLLTTIINVAWLNLALSPVVIGQSTSNETTEEIDPRLSEADELQKRYSELYKQGKYQEAIPLAEKALSLRQQVLGNNHPDVATSLNNLAELYCVQGRYKEAEPLFLQALDIDKKQRGEDHPSVATSLNNLAALYWNQKDINATLTYLSQGLAVEEYNLDYNLPAGSEVQKQSYLRTLGWSTNAPISFHLQTAPDNSQASVLAFTTIAQRKGRLLDFLSRSQQLLRLNLDPSNQQMLDELNDAKTELSNLYHYRPEEITPEYQQQLQ